MGETGEQLGIYSIKDALRKGWKRFGFSEVALMQSRRFAKLMDYGKYRYEQSNGNEIRKKQKIITVKEVKNQTENR